MGRRRRSRGRDVNGILLLDKPLGVTSNSALQDVKRFYKAAKAGHTGSLDPLADGMLPICLGSATKLSAYLLDSDKHYQVRVRLGETSATGDAEGDILETRPTDGITEEDVKAVLKNFVGDIKQIPPMYSALKHNGQRLYKLAREGVVVEREPRDITIHALSSEHYDLPEFDMSVHCSKGTYVRTLAEDIGEALGCGAHVVGLRRTAVGPYKNLPMVTLEQLAEQSEKGLAALDEMLLPLDTALSDWPAINLNPDAAYYLKMGQPVMVPKAPSEGWVRLYEPEELFVGIGEIQADGLVAPKRLMQNTNS